MLLDSFVKMPRNFDEISFIHLVREFRFSRSLQIRGSQVRRGIDNWRLTNARQDFRQPRRLAVMQMSRKHSVALVAGSSLSSLQEEVLISESDAWHPRQWRLLLAFLLSLECATRRLHINTRMCGGRTRVSLFPKRYSVAEMPCDSSFSLNEPRDVSPAGEFA